MRNLRIKDSMFTYILIALNVLIFVYTEFIYSYAKVRLGLIPAAVSNSGQIYRLVTHMFVHSNLPHIAMNMIALFGLGQMVELGSGHVRFLILYFSSGLAGGILTMIIAEPMTNTIGASGAIFGLMAAAAVQMVKRGDRQTLMRLVICIAINISNTFTAEDISISAHLGGLFAGFVVAIFLIPKVYVPRTSKMRVQGAASYGSLHTNGTNPYEQGFGGQNSNGYNSDGSDITWVKDENGIFHPYRNLQFCPHCGNKLEGAVKFCPQCGAGLNR